MKYFLLFFVLTGIVGCASKTQYGDCIGLNGKENPKLEYEYNGTNIVIGLIFWELIVPPVVVLLDQTKCPIGEKK